LATGAQLDRPEKNNKCKGKIGALGRLTDPENRGQLLLFVPGSRIGACFAYQSPRL